MSNFLKIFTYYRFLVGHAVYSAHWQAIRALVEPVRPHDRDFFALLTHFLIAVTAFINKMRNFAVKMMEPKKSIYQRAAEWGLPFGLYLACAAVASIYADWFTPLSMVFLLLLVCTPVVVYYFQRRKFIEDDGFTEYAALWMLGILLFILGALVAGVIVFIVLQYCRPGYIYEQAQMVVDAYSKMPQMRDSELLTIVKRAIDEKMLPTPIETVFNAFWFITFAGSLLSALTALVAQRPLRRPGRRT